MVIIRSCVLGGILCVFLVDIKLTRLENFMFTLSSAIKTANAKTELGIEVDVDDLLSPIE